MKPGHGELLTSLTSICLVRSCPPNLVVQRPGVHEDSASPVRQRWPARGIQAQGVALDHVSPGQRPEKLDADGTIAGDQVARTSRRTTDHVVRRIVDEDAVEPIRDRRGASGIRADLVALDEIAAGRPTRPTRDLESDEPIAGDEITLHGVPG